MMHNRSIGSHSPIKVYFVKIKEMWLKINYLSSGFDWVSDVTWNEPGYHWTPDRRILDVKKEVKK